MTSLSVLETAADAAQVDVRFCGEVWGVSAGAPFRIGAAGDLVLDVNPFLHREFLVVEHAHGLWWLRNVGPALRALVTDGMGGVQAWLVPGGSVPLVFALSIVIFTAGPTTYEFAIHTDSPVFGFGAGSAPPTSPSDEVDLTPAQRLLLLALAEPVLLGGAGPSAIPTSARASARLGWTRTRFNRKLDNVCEKLDRAGVSGLRGDAGSLAVNRRARLVEYAVGTRLVVADELRLLDSAPGRGVA